MSPHDAGGRKNAPRGVFSKGRLTPREARLSG